MVPEFLAAGLVPARCSLLSPVCPPDSDSPLQGGATGQTWGWRGQASEALRSRVLNMNHIWSQHARNMSIPGH